MPSCNAVGARPRASEDDETTTGEGLGRILAFSDGVFAIAMTLLVLNLDVRSGQSFDEAMHGIGPRLWSAALSFAVIGRYWVAHHRTFSLIHRLDGTLLTLNLALLAPIVIMPFTTELLADYGGRSASVMVYAASIGASGTMLSVILAYSVTGRRLVATTVSTDLVARRLVGTGWAASVFLVSIPIALASPLAAELFWLLNLLPESRLVPLVQGSVHRLADRQARPRLAGDGRLDGRRDL
jgi:uncharacterized membrane protein